MARKIAVVVTARPSYARVKTVLQAVQAHPDLELQLVVAASALLERYGNVAEVMRSEGFEAAMEVHMVVEGETPLTSTKTVGLGIVEMSNVLHHLRPAAVISVADRYETITTAISAAYMNIPVAHVQGGEVTGSIDEKVRHAVTKLSDLHFVSNESAANRVRKMGENPKRVHVTGCPSIDLASWVMRNGNNPELNASLEHHVSRGVGETIDPNRDYVICMQHPVTYEWGDAGAQIMETMVAVHESGVPCFWFWPNVDAGSDLTSKAIRAYREQKIRQEHPLLEEHAAGDFPASAGAGALHSWQFEHGNPRGVVLGHAGDQYRHKAARSRLRKQRDACCTRSESDCRSLREAACPRPLRKRFRLWRRQGRTTHRRTSRRRGADHGKEAGLLT